MEPPPSSFGTSIPTVPAPESLETCDSSGNPPLTTRVQSSNSFLIGEQFANSMLDNEGVSSSFEEGIQITNPLPRWVPGRLPGSYDDLQHDEDEEEPYVSPATRPPEVERNEVPLQPAATNSAGRPPRAPIRPINVTSADGTTAQIVVTNRTTLDTAKSSLPKLPAPPPLHDRAYSNSEVSFLSALTDPMDDEDQTPPRQDRGVASGMDCRTTNRDTPGMIVQPVLDTHGSTHTPPPLLGRAPQPTEAPNVASHHRRLDTLTMTDVPNPIESEAEKAIMKALEKHERASFKGETSTGASIPTNMTDDAVATWQIRSNHESPSCRGDIPTSDTVKMATATTTTKTTATTKTIPSPPNHSSHVSSSSKTTQGSKKAALGSSKTTLGSSKGSPGENKKQPQKPAPLKEHSKSTTTATSGDGSVESTLHNLANIMRNIHQNEENSNMSGKDQGQAIASNGKSHHHSPTPVEVPKTQSDTLANHAALIFRGRTKDEPGPAVTSVASTIADAKKNDDAIVKECEHDTDSSKDHDVELGTSNGANASGRVTKRRQSRGVGIVNAAKEDLEIIVDFFVQQRLTFLTYMKHILLLLILPATCMAAILFYFLSNPKMKVGYDEDTKSFPSVSWFILFLCVRQVITFSLARLTEVVMIDMIALKTRIMIHLLGPFLTLVIVQSKGWPFMLAWWAVYGLCMLSGGGAFAKHWAFYQNLIHLFNDHNPSGNITSNDWNFRVLYAALIIGIIVAIKRFAVGLHLGGRQYGTFRIC
jgi:hypothetical protein